jgi:hypothetical protein
VSPADAPRLRRFLDALAPHSRHLRFLDQAGDSAIATDRATQPAGSDAGGVVIQVDGEVVAHGAFARLYGPRAEVSLQINPDYRAVAGPLLLGELAKLAQAAGIDALELSVRDAGANGHSRDAS